MSLIVKRHHRLPESGIMLYAGDEVAPGSLEAILINRLLDADILVEVPTRISYFALLPSFAGVSPSAKLATVANFPELVIPPLDSRAGKE
jgi:hypothetical protein